MKHLFIITNTGQVPTIKTTQRICRGVADAFNMKKVEYICHHGPSTNQARALYNQLKILEMRNEEWEIVFVNIGKSLIILEDNEKQEFLKIIGEWENRDMMTSYILGNLSKVYYNDE